MVFLIDGYLYCKDMPDACTDKLMDVFLEYYPVETLLSWEDDDDWLMPF